MRDCHFNFLLRRHPQVRFCSLLSFVDYDQKWRSQENTIKGLTNMSALRESWSRSGNNPEWKQLADQSFLTDLLTTFPSHIHHFFRRLWNKLPKIENIPSVPIDRAAVSPKVTLVRWKVHQDWVTQVRSLVCFCWLRVNSGVCGDNPGVPAELTFLSVGQILPRLSGGCLLIQWGVFLSCSRFFFPSFFFITLIIVIKSDVDLSHGDLILMSLVPPRGRALPLTDAEKRLTEIREACYEGKTKKVQLSWTPQLRASHDQTAFSVNKGVKTFDLCGKHSVLVTGGLDRLVRVWNPHFSGWEITMNSSGIA